MAKTRTNTGVSISDWHVDQIRVTSFPKERVDLDRFEDIWKSISEHEPDVVEKRPRFVVHRLTKPDEGFCLELVGQVDRVEWRLRTEALPKCDQAALPCIDSLDKVLKTFTPLAKRWLESDQCLPLMRLAFGAILNMPAESVRDGLKTLSALVPTVRMAPNNTSDFLYQINRPKPSHTGLPGLSINRLARWSSVAYILTELELGQAMTQTTDRKAYASNLVLDINNVPSGEPLPREKLPVLLDELISFGTQIAVKGDVQ